MVKVTFKIRHDGLDMYGSSRFAMYFNDSADTVQADLKKALKTDPETLVTVHPAALKGAALQVPAVLFLSVEQLP
jgi:hypothetical protein